MQYIKYFTNPIFNREQFVELLNTRMGVKAYAVSDGVILNRDAFNAIPGYEMPHWAWLNKKFINSELHTRPATPDEWPE